MEEHLFMQASRQHSEKTGCSLGDAIKALAKKCPKQHAEYVESLREAGPAPRVRTPSK
ncbi:MAG: hypothetical protein WCT04_23090 [Planctomycetota bacterium]